MKWQISGSKQEGQFQGQLLGDVPPELQDLIPGFVERREEEVNHLKEFLARADFNSIKEVGHRIKGSGANYGFESITRIGQKMEIAASSRDRIHTQELIDDLDAITKQIRAALKRQ